MIGAVALCLVVAVSDGDTLKVRFGEPSTYEQITIRLGEIDAPEKRQPFGQRSKEVLSDLCYNVPATVRPTTRDKYGRTVARVECNGKDASAELVHQGMAWAFTRYLTDPAIAQAEAAAKAARIGLWTDASAMPPWEWRAMRNGASTAGQ